MAPTRPAVTLGQVTSWTGLSVHVSPLTRHTDPQDPRREKRAGRLDLALWEWAGPPRMLPRPILECSPGQQEQPIVGSDTLLPPARAVSSGGAGSDRRVPFSHPGMPSSSLTLQGRGARFSPCSRAGHRQILRGPASPRSPAGVENSLPLPPHRGESPERRLSAFCRLCKV